MSGEGSTAGLDPLMRRVAEVGHELERARFGGASPVVVVPTDADALEVAARTLAAERMNALLRLDGQDYNPQEDQAEADLGAVEPDGRRIDP